MGADNYPPCKTVVGITLLGTWKALSIVHVIEYALINTRDYYYRVCILPRTTGVWSLSWSCGSQARRKLMPSGHLVGHRFSMAGCVCLSRDTVGSRTCGPARAAICMKLEQVPRCQSFARRVAATWSHTAARCGNVAGVSSRSRALSRLQGHHTATDPYLAGREPSTGRQAPLARKLQEPLEPQERGKTRIRMHWVKINTATFFPSV